MFVLGGLLLRWRLKWIFASGLCFGVLRFTLSALNGKMWVLAGVMLHGCSYTLVLITAQIYLEERVTPPGGRGAGPVHPDDQRCGEPAGLPRHRFVVQRLHRHAWHPMAAFLGRAGRSGGRRAGLLP